MGAWRKPAHVRKVQVLRDEKASDRLCRLPDVSVILAGQALLRDGIGLMVKYGKNANKPDG